MSYQASENSSVYSMGNHNSINQSVMEDTTNGVPITETGKKKKEILYRYTLYLRENKRILGNDPLTGKFPSKYVKDSKFKDKEISYNGKQLAEFAIEEWKNGSALAILTLDMKKLLIDELLAGGLTEKHVDSISNLIEFSEEVHQYHLLDHFEDKSNGGTYRLSSILVDSVNKIRIKHQSGNSSIPSTGTWPSENTRMVFERTYINAMRHLSKNYDGEKDLNCLNVFRLVTLQRGYKKTYPKIRDKWKTLGDHPSINDAIELLKKMKLAHPKKVLYPSMDPFDALQELKDEGLKTLAAKYKNDPKIKSLKIPSAKNGFHEKIGEKGKGTALQDYIKERVKGKEGWFLFALSIVDGIHTITMAVNVRGGKLFCYWLDQLDKDEPGSSVTKNDFGKIEGTAAGLRQLNFENLDEYISYTSNDYWKRLGWYNVGIVEKKDPTHNPKSQVTIAELSPHEL